MKRRKFIGAAVVTTTLPVTYALAGPGNFSSPAIEEKELYELRTYELKLGGNLKLLKSYLKDALQPALKRKGVNQFMMFTELGETEPLKLWVLISYPSPTIYFQSQDLTSDKSYLSQSETYRSISPDKAIYDRISTSLLLAFDGLPAMKAPVPDASIFELRTYEGYSEDATRRKIKMFNEGELDVFMKTNLNPVFFGEMIAGPYLPCLTYMINFKDMEDHDKSWDAFINHPEWISMKNDPQYANTVSKIRKVFLKPVS